MKDKLCVVIPVHRPQPDRSEIISLLQCKKILGKYAVYLVYPDQMKTAIYEELYPGLQLMPVDKAWLGSIEGYNRMKRSLAFYRLFGQYQYMLTYELDAFIFSDDWERANCFEYDYIGAPWFKHWKVSDNPDDLLGAGNSGFSLRNIQHCIRVLEATNKIKKSWKTFSGLQLHRIISFTSILHFFNKNWKSGVQSVYLFQLVNDTIMEDIFWADVVPHVFRFKTGSVKDSVQFSFEANPSLLFKINDNKLPLGCHAWKKYDPDFWKPYIDAE